MLAKYQSNIVILLKLMEQENTYFISLISKSVALRHRQLIYNLMFEWYLSK